MFIIQHCRVLLAYLSVYFLVYLPQYLCLVYIIGIPFGRHLIFVQPSLAHPDAMLVWFIPVQLTAESMCRTDNKAYQHFLSKADLLSCLSTTIGPEHEPLHPNGVVNQ